MVSRADSTAIRPLFAIVTDGYDWPSVDPPLRAVDVSRHFRAVHPETPLETDRSSRR